MAAVQAEECRAAPALARRKSGPAPMPMVGTWQRLRDFRGQRRRHAFEHQHFAPASTTALRIGHRMRAAAFGVAALHLVAAQTSAPIAASGPDARRPALRVQPSNVSMRVELETRRLRA
jgi:hypothetical protein